MAGRDVRLWSGAVFLLAAFAVAGCVQNVVPQKPSLKSMGGTEIVYKIDPESLRLFLKSHLASKQDEVVAKVVKNLESRAASFGVAGAEISVDANEQISVQLPGYFDVAEARQFFGRQGKLTVYHAKTVSTPKSKRIFESVQAKEDVDGVPTASFTRGPNLIEYNADPTKRQHYQEMIDSWSPVVTGEDIEDAWVEVSEGRYNPHFKFSDAGAAKLTSFCRRYMNLTENLAFVVDGRVLQVAPLQDGAVLSDHAYINGDFDPQYVKVLTDTIKTGAMPVQLIEVDVAQIGRL